MYANDDADAWELYPQLRFVYNKLWVASLNDGLAYGPGGIDVPRSGWYVIRPVVNVRGMGSCARIEHLEPQCLEGVRNRALKRVSPGSFWQQYVPGNVMSVDYLLEDGLPIRFVEGFVLPGNRLGRFLMWRKLPLSMAPALPEKLANALPHDGGTEPHAINVEYIGGHIVEVHLRENPDPNRDMLLPVFAGDIGKEPPGDWVWIDDPDSADDYTDNKRLGFWATRT